MSKRSNRSRARRHQPAKMTANSVDLDTRPCGDCGEPFTLDAQLYAIAVHDCETGEWFAMPRGVADALNAMPDDQLAELCGVPVEEIQRLRGDQR